LQSALLVTSRKQSLLSKGFERGGDLPFTSKKKGGEYPSTGSARPKRELRATAEHSAMPMQAEQNKTRPRKEKRRVRFTVGS